MADGVTENDLLRDVASAEQSSEHPIAQAIVNYVQSRDAHLSDATSGWHRVLGDALLAVGIISTFAVAIGALRKRRAQ